MFDQFFHFYFSYLNSFLYAGVNLLGIYAGFVLLRRTRNKGPLLVMIGCIAKLFVGISFPLSNFLQDRFYLDYDLIQQIWLSLSFCDLLGTALLLIGLVLIAKEFRAHLDYQNISQNLSKSP